MLPLTAEQRYYRFYRLAWSGLDWLYPPHCGGCGKAGSRWCDECQQSTQALPDVLCQCCGEPLSQPGICPRCEQLPPLFTALRSWAHYDGPLRRAIQRLKYAGDVSLGEILARPLIAMFHGLSWQADVVTPVPASLKRRKQRGYNQAALLALPLALACGIPYRPKGLIKTRETPSQVGLDLYQRRANVAGAFRASPALVNGKCVLLVDDVTTSGATLTACAQALQDAGATRVYGLTLARADQ